MNYNNLNTRPGLKNEGLRCVESGKISGPSGVVGQTDSHHCVGTAEKVARLFEEQGSFRLHKSLASARISCINGFVVGTGAVGHGVNKLAGLVEDDAADVG
jgi:hypothetical protein